MDDYYHQGEQPQQTTSSAGSSIDHHYQHRHEQPASFSGSSMDNNYQHSKYPTYIADNFNSLDQVLTDSSIELWKSERLWILEF